jgi:hypothetical protein
LLTELREQLAVRKSEYQALGEEIAKLEEAIKFHSGHSGSEPVPEKKRGRKQVSENQTQEKLAI